MSGPVSIQGISAGTNTIGNVKIAGANSRIATLDGNTYAQNIIDYQHHEIHDSNAYYFTYAASVNDGNRLQIRIAQPDTTKWAHFTFEVSATGEVDLYFYEGTSKTHVVANVIAPFNRNRNSSNASGLTICHTPGGAGAGTLIGRVFFGTDTGGGATRRVSGGGVDTRGEIILKQNTAYLLSIDSGTDGNRITVIGDWYEHTNKE